MASSGLDLIWSTVRMGMPMPMPAGAIMSTSKCLMDEWCGEAEELGEVLGIGVEGSTKGLVIDFRSISILVSKLWKFFVFSAILMLVSMLYLVFAVSSVSTLLPLLLQDRKMKTRWTTLNIITLSLYVSQRLSQIAVGGTLDPGMGCDTWHDLFDLSQPWWPSFNHFSPFRFFLNLALSEIHLKTTGSVDFKSVCENGKSWFC